MRWDISGSAPVTFTVSLVALLCCPAHLHVAARLALSVALLGAGGSWATVGLHILVGVDFVATRDLTK